MLSVDTRVFTSPVWTVRCSANPATSSLFVLYNKHAKAFREFDLLGHFPRYLFALCLCSSRYKMLFMMMMMMMWCGVVMLLLLLCELGSVQMSLSGMFIYSNVWCLLMFGSIFLHCLNRENMHSCWNSSLGKRKQITCKFCRVVRFEFASILHTSLPVTSTKILFCGNIPSTRKLPSIIPEKRQEKKLSLINSKIKSELINKFPTNFPRSTLLVCGNFSQKEVAKKKAQHQVEHRPPP